MSCSAEAKLCLLEADLTGLVHSEGVRYGYFTVSVYFWD